MWQGQGEWSKTNLKRRLAYMQRVLRIPLLKGKLFFASYQDTLDYLPLTARTVARAITYEAGTAQTKTTVLIDGLPSAQEHAVGRMLHRAGVRLRKVRGVKRDENDALIRLADALCGFVRAAHVGQPALRQLFEHAVRLGTMIDLSGQ